MTKRGKTVWVFRDGAWVEISVYDIDIDSHELFRIIPPDATDPPAPPKHGE